MIYTIFYIPLTKYVLLCGRQLTWKQLSGQHDDWSEEAKLEPQDWSYDVGPDHSYLHLLSFDYEASFETGHECTVVAVACHQHLTFVPAVIKLFYK